MQLCVKERDSFATDLAQDEAVMSKVGKAFSGALVSAFSLENHHFDMYNGTSAVWFSLLAVGTVIE